MREPRYTAVEPSAARLTESLRDVGYDFPSAVADLVDNSIAAEASQVDILIEYAGRDSRVVIADNGKGMPLNGVHEALRFGSRRDYEAKDLGRYGLGLKTASLSQARSVTVLSRSGARNVTIRQLSLDTILEFDEWLVIEPNPSHVYAQARDMLLGTGTVIVWEHLDRIFLEQKPEGGWARRRLERLADKTAEHLAIVFHRFLEGTAARKVHLTLNGEKIEPWNPFAEDEIETKALAPLSFELTAGPVTGQVFLDRFVLPSRNSFSTPAKFESLSGPRKWNRQQGLYIYRSDRLVQWGGWAGLRGIDEHLKLARAALYFDNDLDAAFNINVAKMRVSIPAQLRPMLERPIHELCLRADEAYRRAAEPVRDDQGRSKTPTTFDGGVTLLSLRASARAVGESQALNRILQDLYETSPEVAAGLGFQSRLNDRGA